MNFSEEDKKWIERLLVAKLDEDKKWIEAQLEEQLGSIQPRLEAYIDRHGNQTSHRVPQMGQSDRTTNPKPR
jgi:ribonucleotide reductase beta subunit family protein with ferritin-like domain